MNGGHGRLEGLAWGHMVFQLLEFEAREGISNAIFMAWNEGSSQNEVI